jgi:nucleotide-binding universal stress UspA family protein
MYLADAQKQITEYVEREQRQADTQVVGFMATNGFQNRGWQRHVREGTPTEVIYAAAETLGPDLVVVGMHGRSGIARMFIGSVTESLLRTLKTDILAVPPPS